MLLFSWFEVWALALVIKGTGILLLAAHSPAPIPPLWMLCRVTAHPFPSSHRTQESINTCLVAVCMSFLLLSLSLTTLAPAFLCCCLTQGMSWSQIAGKLPCGRTEAEKIQRAQLFNKIDCNHNEYVSPEEAINGMRANLPFQHDAIEDVMRTACRHIQKLTKQGQEVRPPNIAVRVLLVLIFPIRIPIPSRPTGQGSFPTSASTQQTLKLGHHIREVKSCGTPKGGKSGNEGPMDSPWGAD